MKVLMLYCEKFGYQTSVKSLADMPEMNLGQVFTNVQVAFIHVEAADQERSDKVLSKFINFTKWLMRKNNCHALVLHSFAHLSESKAEPEFTKDFFERAMQRFHAVGYTVNQTPFGYFLDLQIMAPGFSLARVFKEL